MKKVLVLSLAAILILGNGCAQGDKHFIGALAPNRCEDILVYIVLLPVLLPACFILEAIWDAIFPPTPPATPRTRYPRTPDPSANGSRSQDAPSRPASERNGRTTSIRLR